MDDIVSRLIKGDPLFHDGRILQPWAHEAAAELLRLNDEVERLRKLAFLWKRAAKNWRGVAYGGGTTNVEDARDAYTAAEEADLAG